jgi:hypothetical protein
MYNFLGIVEISRNPLIIFAGIELPGERYGIEGEFYG